ncbi:endoplasmic reticulum metallopeptidase 1 [Teleopsis dalmanni]|uniref:endoplasmic reticulum metallopeptidase 1 n=1 Tax=Teleopsis dalmanni TaxID=139649 RepID=UPI0018CE3446|nr:endoplasmic reticulum metallopeptidase 1 [Teleopsis dalmanni]
MTSAMSELFSDSTDKKESTKFQWYWAPVYCAIWFLLFYVAVIPSFYSYPETLLIRDEHKYPDQFIGERAQIQLLELASIGIKLTGTVENEVHAINFLRKEIEKIKASARTDLYDIDVNVQYSSGKFMLWGMATSYHNVSNVIVKISPKNSKSESYLLVNSHFDSEVGSPAAADAGVMIVVMLETLRVISISDKPLNNPIVFLFNGAEESNLLAAHGFITQHEWAQNCKALINLDSAGSGGREILFQSGPNHPWLMKYYKKSAVHPYASTIGEELFQNDFIPSDTDFRVFRDYHGLPGLDMAHTLNGYVYHTKYDNFGNLERGTYQTTGENVLALTWALANAKELENPKEYSEGHTVFYDYLGWFMIFYKESTGIAINITSSVCALIAICVSIYMTTKEKYIESAKHVYMKFSIIIAVQILAVSVAMGVTILIGVIVDAMGLTQAWYSEEWLIFGLYFCPMFFTLSMIPALYIHWTKKITSLKLNDTIAFFMHAHCIILVFICLLMTGLSIRSAFFPMIAIFFYAISVILNILAKFIFKGRDYYICIHLLCQLFPFWFYTYLTFAFLKTFIPMQGRDGPTSNPELFISGFTAIMSIHFAGFILPILHKFRKSITLISVFGILTIIFVIIAATPAGFPYKKDVAAQRFYVLHTNRVIHDFDGFVTKNNSGFYIQPVDTRPKTLDDSTFKDAFEQSWIQEECASEVFCGLPLYNTRWMDWKNSSRWIPATTPVFPIETELKLLKKEYLPNAKIRFEFSVKAADRIVIYIDPYSGTKVTDWSFDDTPLKENFATPYFVYHVYSMDTTPLYFWIEFERDSPTYEGPTFRIGVGAHFLYHENDFTEEYKTFLKSFPEWSYATKWIASFNSWMF